MSPGEEVFNPPVIVRLLAAGSGGDPPTQGRKLPGLWEMTQSVAVSVKLVFQLGTSGTGLECCQLAGVIKVK
jgi:hypothetical protein